MRQVPLPRETGVSRQGVQTLAPELLESLSDLLATMLVNAWGTQHSQGLTQSTVKTPGGLNRGEKGLAQEKSRFGCVVPERVEPIYTPAKRAT